MGKAEQPSIESVLLRRLSPPRLTPYLEAGGNLQNAVHLYRWNIDLSGAVYEALHIFEVVLRNAIDEQLCLWNAAQPDPRAGRLHSSDWLLDPSALLERLAGRDIPEAKARASKSTRRRPQDQRQPHHADILAAMSLGTWRFILPSRHDAGKQRLWEDAVRHAFPHLTRSARDLERAVDGVYRLRNRVAHLEPLINSRIEAQLVNMRTVIGAIDQDMLSWFASVERIGNVLKQRPQGSFNQPS
ncbi:Abi family protein [Arthrobacter sp. H14]|uniref:Abi family protein n=1 Tax=Arthrobacter sp. H14 TaxID=1312959 RepID=UPI00047B8998|nr:Abi family protein [Arthrobacter sp. H14]